MSETTVEIPRPELSALLMAHRDAEERDILNPAREGVGTLEQVRAHLAAS